MRKGRLDVKRCQLVAIAALSVLALSATAQQPREQTQPPPNQTRPSSSQDQNRSTYDTSPSDSSSADHRFVKEAAEGGMAEVELGQLAAENASNSEVKKFGQRMVEDHQKANDRLKEIASKKGIDLPTEPGARQKATKERLAKLSGEAFDKAYVETMLKDHKKDVAEFEKESSNGRDPEVKQFASETLPTLQDHLKEVQSIAPKVQESTRSSNSQSPSQ